MHPQALHRKRKRAAKNLRRVMDLFSSSTATLSIFCLDKHLVEQPKASTAEKKPFVYSYLFNNYQTSIKKIVDLSMLFHI